MNIRKIISIALALVMVISICACGTGTYNAGEPTANGGSANASSGGSSASSGSGGAKDTLVVGAYSDPVDLNPQSQTSQYSQQIKCQMYETLVDMDNDGVIHPNLATEWEWEDDTTLILKLRQGVKFHTGAEFTAKDVLFTFKMMRESDYAQLGVQYMDLDKTEAVDDYTVKVVLTEPFAAQLNYFNWPLSAVISADGYEQADGNFSKMSFGTGPYKLVSYVKDSEVVMTKHDEYWEDGKPHIPNLTFRIIPEETSRTLDLESGGIDVAINLSIMDVDRLDADPNMTVLRQPCYNMTNIFYNTKNNAALKDYNVRKALSMAVDWDAAIPASYGANGIPGTAYVAEGVEGHISFDPLPYDPEGARRLLQDAGYSDGEIVLDMYTSNMEIRVKLCEIMQAYLAEIGVKMNVVVMENAAWHDAFLNGEHDMMIMGYFGVTGEAGKVLLYFLSDNSFNATMNWEKPEFDALAKDAMTDINAETRIEKYRQAQQMIYDDLAAYPILQSVLLVGTRANVKGLTLNAPYEQHKYKDVYFE